MKAKLILCLLIFAYQSIHAQQQSLMPDSARQKSILEKLCKLIAENYVFPEKAVAIVHSLKAQQQLGAYRNLTTADAFAAALAKDIRSVHNDKHIRISFDPKLEKDIRTFEGSKQGSKTILNADLEDERQQNFFFKKVEVLPGNIGYINFTNFARPGVDALKTLHAAMQFVRNTDALIFDLRNNFGGNGQMVNEVLRYFLPSNTQLGRSFNKIENKWSPILVPGKSLGTESLLLNMPVYVLTSSRTYSAAEGLAYNLQTLKDAVLIGDTTRGGAHLTRSFSLGDGFVAFVPYLRTENLKTKTDWEGIGVIPTLSTAENLSLLKAQQLALAKKLGRTVNTKEKNKLSWLMNYYQVQAAPINVNPADYHAIAGRYAEFEIAVTDTQLLFRDTNQKNKTYSIMSAISPTLFQVEKDYQVQLVKDAAGRYSAITMYWEDGWMETINRSN